MNSIKPEAATTVLGQLVQCRELALADASNYKKIVPAVLSSTGAGNPLDQRRWGADFLAETFASPVLAVEHKQDLSLGVLDLLRQNLEAPNEDTSILKNTVQIATSIYPLIFKHTIYHPNDAKTWQNMVAIKSNILRRMDKSPAGIKVCCIKFIQRVVQVQTSGIITDPRRPEHNDLSLALVPARHPLIVSSNLEAEASGLLDRLLNVFQQASSDALYVTATLNCLGILIRTRASIANKILQAILSFDPLRHEEPITPQQRVNIKSKERTVKAFLTNLNKRNPSHPLAGRIVGYMSRLQQQRGEVLDPKRKITAVEPTDGLDAEKRQKLDAEVGPPALPPGNVSVAQIFTLTQNPNAATFDVTTLPPGVVSQLLVPLLNAADNDAVSKAVNVVRTRWQDLLARDKQLKEQNGQTSAALDPITNAVKIGSSAQAGTAVTNVPRVVEFPDVKTALFKLPFPLTFNMAQNHIYMDEKYDDTLARVSEHEAKIMRVQGARVTQLHKKRTGWNKVTVQILIRAATKPYVEKIGGNDSEPRPGDPNFETNRCRERLFLWIMEDWRRRLEVAVDWMQAEWTAENFETPEDGVKNPEINCYALQCKLLDAIMPYVDGKDTKIIQFFAGIVLVDAPLLDRIRKMAEDPDRATLAANVCLYMIMYRPCAKETCLDILEGLYHNNAAAKAVAAKYLRKHRPAALNEGGSDHAKGEPGVKSEAPSKMEVPVKVE